MEILPMGVFYRRSDGAEVNLSAGEQWLIDLKPEGGVLLRRFLGGVIDESYRPMDDAEGVIAAASIILGFEPPRGQPRRERLVP